MKSIYVLSDGKNSKIGITNNIHKRLTDYATHNPNHNLIALFDVNSNGEAYRIEASIKSLYKNLQVGTSTEWFSIEPNEIVKVLQVLLKQTGETDIKSKIKQRPFVKLFPSYIEILKKGIPKTDQIVLFTLIENMSSQGHITITQEFIAAELQIQQSQVSRAIKNLIKANLLIKKKSHLEVNNHHISI